MDETLVAGRTGVEGSCAWLDGARFSREVRFGKRVGMKKLPPEIRRLEHSDGGVALMPEKPSLESTRFKKGFQRRQMASIRSDEERLDRAAKKNAEKAHHDAKRRDLLNEQANYNGFDLVTGHYDASKIRNQRKQARYLSDRPSDELVKAGEIQVRNSHYRFYVDKPDPHRRALLLKEGLDKPKFSSVLGVGRFDARSDGVEDQFSRSQYGGPTTCRVPGLVDAWTQSASNSSPPPPAGRARIFGATWRPE